MNKKYRVNLTQSQRDYLTTFTKKGVESARKITRARILLYADEAIGNPKTDKEIAELLGIASSTVVRIRMRFCEGDVENALSEKKRKGRPVKLGGDEEAKIIALATSETPKGRNKWTLRLLENKQTKLELSNEVSYRTIGRILKIGQKLKAPTGAVRSLLLLNHIQVVCFTRFISEGLKKNIRNLWK